MPTLFPTVMEVDGKKISVIALSDLLKVGDDLCAENTNRQFRKGVKTLVGHAIAQVEIADEE